MKMLIFGHGYTARFLTPLLIANGWNVAGTTRDKPEIVAGSGAEPLIWGRDDDQIRAALISADAVLISIAPDKDGDPVINTYRGDLAQTTPLWLGYLSTTGVYGDRGGAWVDEDSPLQPATLRGRYRVVSENVWRDLAAMHALPLHIFRLPGIYGPHRGPFEKLRNGTARRIIKPDQVFSRIHVEDIAQVLRASIEAPQGGRIYNVCDDEPAPPQDIIAHAAQLLKLPIPDAIDFDKADLPPMAQSFYAESKRVRNNRIKDELGIRLLYPDYRAGLAAILRAETERDE